MKTVTVAVPMCAPSRSVVASGLRQYLDQYRFVLGGISVQEVKEKGATLYWQADIRFTDDAVKKGWAEYALLRRGLDVISPPHVPAAWRWAAPYLQHKPEQGGWYEATCKDKPKNAHIVGVPDGNPPPPWKDQPKRGGKRRGWRDWFGL